MFLGLLGFMFTFLPLELTTYFNINHNLLNILIFQIFGALYLSFSILNWMSKNNILGGIYGRPLITANLIHFLVSTIALYKNSSNFNEHNSILLILTIVYTIYTFSFLYVFMSHPSQIKKNAH
jgi:hypothetical protein